MSLKGSLKLPGWESTRGEKHRNAILTESQAYEIKFSQTSEAELASKFNVSMWTVRNIRKGLRWKHLRRVES